MLQVDLNRYLFYSFLIHISILGWVTLQTLSQKTSKTYYAVEFYGGVPAQGSLQVETKKVQEEVKVKTKFVNPQEDLLLKSKAKLKKNEKEIVSTLPPPLPPPPAPLSPVARAGSLPPEIPGIASGVGIGFGNRSLGSGSGAGNFPYTWYVQSIRKKLDSSWNVSTGFNRRIAAQVAFTIRRDGSIEELAVEETSGNEIYDRAALRAVEYAAPLPALPADFPESDLRVHVRFTLKQ